MTGAKLSPFRIGTCGYSYPGTPPEGWSGVFYPKSRGRRSDKLEFYATYFNAVEINSTFYRPATAAMANGWVKKTPEDFEFAVKVWQKFTHPKKLGVEAAGSSDSWESFAAADVDLFCQGIAPLSDAGKLGPLLFQYPASFHRFEENLEKLSRTLAAFEPYRKVVELRHKSWSDHAEETYSLLSRLNSAWAYIDEPKFDSSVKQELDFSGSIAYLRLHGRNQEKWWRHQAAWERYDYFYPPASVRRLGTKLKQFATKSPATTFYVFFNNHARGQAVANALMLESQLADGKKSPAPQALVEAFPDLKDFVGGAGRGELDPG
ncbi:MAG: DUF72 domain-containing protein [Candidatus Binatia bacterium]|nr:DUF72 domain-containing protein [Candidatus Binatia bacterium]